MNGAPFTSGGDTRIEPLTDRHKLGANLSFVDGHAEYWKWRSPKPKQERHCDVIEATDPGDRADRQRLERAVPQ